MNTVTPVVDADDGLEFGTAPSAERRVFDNARGYGISSAGSFKLSSAKFRRRSRTGPSPAAIRQAAEEIDRAESRQGQDRHSTLDAQAVPINWHSIHPHGKFRKRWDISQVFLILYSSLVIPFRLGFSYTPQFGLQIFDYIVDGFFAIDIVFNFCTGLEMKDKSIDYDKKNIMVDYFKSWFWIDIISVFPWEVILEGKESDLPQLFKTLRLTRLTRLLRMFRLLRVIRIVHRLEYSLSIQEGFRHLGFFILTLVFLSHWFSCLFYYLGDVNRDNDNYWAVASAGDLHTSAMVKNYIAACTWSIMTLTTVGYGDISARNEGQRVLSILAMLTGALFFAYGVSHIVSIIDEFRAETKKFKTQMDKYNSYMAARNLPDHLRGDIREFLHNIRRRHRASIQDEEVLLSNLSMGLRSRVAMAINDQYLREMPFFLGADVNLTQELALNMESVFYSAYEDVMRQGEDGDAMYFIVAGSVEILVGKVMNRVAVLVEKQYFGEAALLMPEGNRKRTATVRTLVFSEFRILRSEEFVRILKEYPETRKQIEQLAESRMQVLRKKSQADTAGGEEGGKQLRKMQSKKMADLMADSERRSKATSKTLIEALAHQETEVARGAFSALDKESKRLENLEERLARQAAETLANIEEMRAIMSIMKAGGAEVAASQATARPATTVA